LQASNGVHTATLNVVIRIDNVPCPCSPSACLSVLKSAIQAGPNIIKGSKVVGRWIVQGGKNVAQLVYRNGKVVAVDADEAGEDAGEGAAQGALD
jgi:hypothetical protein